MDNKAKLLTIKQASQIVEGVTEYGTGNCRTVQEFMQKYPPQEKHAKARER